MAVNPKNISNTYVRHLVLWILFLPVLLLIFLPLISKDQLPQPSELEFASTLQPLSVTNRLSDSNFSKMFINTGIYQTTQKLFIQEKSSEKIFLSLPFKQRWNIIFWQMIYRAIWRFNAYLLPHIYFIIFMSIATITDACMVALKNRSGESFPSASMSYFALHGVCLTVGGSCCCLLMPFEMTIIMLVSIFLLFLMCLWGFVYRRLS